MAARVARVAREDIEEKVGKSVITSQNSINYQYLLNDKNILDKK